MTPLAIRRLIAAGESADVEFKGESRRPLSDAALLEAVVCLTNRRGTESGWLLVGVEDDGRVTGMRPRHEADRTDPGRVRLLISNRTRPSLTVKAGIHSMGDRDVLAIEVPASPRPVSTADGRYLRRAIGGDGKPACVPFHYHEMQSRQADLGLLDYTALKVPDVDWQALDKLEFERFRRSIRENPARGDQALLELCDLDLAKALGAVETTPDGIAVRVLGLLLFGRPDTLATRVPAHEVAFQRLAGTEVRVNDFFRWPLLRVMEEVESRLRAHNKEQEIMVGMARIAVPDYPGRAVREGVANALIHRDYTRLGATHIQWHDDRMEISSPGGFPEGVHIDNLLVTAPRPRNPLLADAFKRAGIVERTARGIDTIFQEQLRGGRRPPSYRLSTTAGVTLLLPGGDANLSLVRLQVEEGRKDRPLSLPELLLLNHLWLEQQLDATEATVLIQQGPSEVRLHLRSLVRAGLVESRGRQGRESYRLSAQTYRRLGAESEYDAPRGSAPAHHERMVLQYVRANGRIVRREVKELCSLGDSQSTRLLRRLVDEGKLTMHGQRRGTWYSLARRIAPGLHHDS